MSQMNITYQAEHGNVCLLDKWNGGDYLILIVMNKRIRWEVDYIFEAGVLLNTKHIHALVVDDEVQLSYMLERGLPQDLYDRLVEQTNTLIRKFKKHKAFL